MFNNSQTYINTSSIQIATPVVLKSKEVPAEFKGKRFIAAAVMAVSLGVLSLQAGYVLNANAQGNPISAPISTQQTPTPTLTPSATPTPTPGGSTSSSQSQTNNPITAPEVSPSPSSQPSNNNGGGSNGDGGSNNGGGSNSAPSCNNEAPKAPYIVSAVTTGKNEITLTWQKPQGNVTHYSISYGFLKGKPLYGNPNVGNVTKYTVKGLAGGMTYYFTVKAVNDCTPSAASNEIAIKVGGKFINTPAVDFKPGVLGKNTKVSTQSGKPALAKPIIFSMINENKPNNSGLVGQVLNFFKGWF